MLRRPITTLSITAEDVADFEDRRAERLAREKEARRMAAMGLLRDPSKQRAGPHGTAQPPVRGTAAGWEYDSEAEEEEDQDPEGAEGDDDAYADEEDVRAILSSEPQRVVAGPYGRHPEDGRMEVDSSSAPPPMVSPAAGRGVMTAAAAAASQGAIPQSRVAEMAAQISTPMYREGSPVATPPRLARAPHPASGPAAPSSVAGDTPDATAARARSSRTREERIGVAAPERRRRQPPQ